MKRISTILLALLAGAAAMAQQPQPVPGSFGERIDVNVVLLDAIVTDSRGHQILGLGPEDFTVVENGVAQKIQSVDYFTNRKNVSTPEEKAGFKAERMREERYFILFFDKPQEAVLLNRLVHARGAAVDFVNKQMKPNDLVAVAGHDVRLKVYSDFTNDKKQLVRALDDAIAFGRGVTEAPKGSGPSILATVNRNRMMSHTGSTYEALETLADALRPIKARKDLVLFSAGILTPDQTVQKGVAVNKSRFYDRAVYALNTADVSVYPANIVDIPNISPAFHQALEGLAQDTNGEYFRFNPTFTGALRNVEQMTNGYYLISYTTQKPKGQAGFQKVQVTVKNPDFKVRAREGYSFGS
jgi:VWFA-related protein